jgi:hypothetical protein
MFKKSRLAIVLLFFVPFFKSVAQCSGGANGGALSPVPAAAYQTMNVSTGNYYTFVVAAGCMPTYDFSYCAADGSNAAFDSQITILDNTGTYAGGYNDDFCGLQSHVTWTPTIAGTYRVLVSTFSCGSGNTATLAYKVTIPPNMSFTSCTTVQSNISGVTKCDIDQDVICVQVVTAGSCNALSLTQFQLGAGGSTSATLADVSKIHIYYTGTTATFNTTNEFVSGGTVPAGGSNTINGSQTLASGTNYFWIAYDINPASTTGNVVDASCTQITVAAVTHVPTATNPAGTRTIAVCSSYPGTSALNLKHWVKSDAGVTGNPVSAWADQSGAGITGNMVQATVANQPTVLAGTINFQDYIRFNGTSDVLVSNNTFTGTTLFNATDNTIMMIKNIKSGTVDYKWETAPTGSYRIGEELNGSSQRLDFSDDVTGKNSASSTTITNLDVLTEYVSDASSLTLKLNANTDATISHSLTFAPGATLKPLNIGSNDLGNPLYTNVDIAEVMTFNKKLTASELRRVESYLCIKYGLTLGNNAGAGSASIYMGSDGTQIWNNHTGYHNYVIGLGRDNTAGNSLLDKTKTTSVSSLNGSTDIVTLANSSLGAPTTLTNDKTFLMSGSNAGTLATPINVSATHNGPATVIAYQTTRVWATQKTGAFTGNMIMQFDMTQVNGPSGYGTNTNVDMRLLVDDNTNFYDGSAGEHTYSPNVGYTATGGSINFTVPYSDIQSGTGYYTLGSINATIGTLPIELSDFSAKCLNGKTTVKWTTATETNNNHFEIMQSANGINYSEVAKVNGHGNSIIAQHYSVMLNNETKTTFYKLAQVDNNGLRTEFPAVVSVCDDKYSTPVIAPNPFDGSFTVYLNTEKGVLVSCTIYNGLGEVVLKSSEESAGTDYSKVFELTSPGIYFISIETDGQYYTGKLISK